jgi:hypothetical protein
MKKQWSKFLDDNQTNWSYNIVPSLVRKLAAEKDVTEQAKIIDSLATQGVVLTPKGNLDFATNQILSDLF